MAAPLSAAAGLEYQPLPLPASLRAGTAGVDVQGRRPMPRPYAICGARQRPADLGLLGACTRDGEPIALSLDGSFAHGYFGVPGSGKSYMQALLIEMMLLSEPALQQLRQPACALSLPYPGAGQTPELLFSCLPNQHRADLARLSSLGCGPQGFPDGVILTLPERVEELRRRYPYFQVHGIRFTLAELGVAGLLALCGLRRSDDEDQGTLYGAEFMALLRGLAPGFGLADIEAALAAHPLQSRRARQLVSRRLGLCQPYLHEHLGLRRLLRPGRLIIVDIRDEWLAADRAMALFELVVEVLSAPEQRSFPLLLCYDEVHRFARCRRIRDQLSRLVRERRHLDLRVVLSSQDPLSVPRELLAELCAVGLFRCDAQRWIDALRKDCAAFDLLSAADCGALSPGQMYFWARDWVGPRELCGSLLCIEARPRLSHHAQR